MEFNSQIKKQSSHKMFKINPKQCLFMKETDIVSLNNNYAYVTDGNISDFICEIDKNIHISTLIICQDFFYQKIDDWCNLQDQIAILFTHLPSFSNLSNLYLKFEILSQNKTEEIRKINLEAIQSQGRPLSIGSYLVHRKNYENQNEVEFNNVLEMLQSVINSSKQLIENLNIHLIISIDQQQNTKHFIDSLSNIKNLQSLEIKYYCDQFIEESQVKDQNNRNQLLFFNLTRQISKCQYLQNLKLIIPSLNNLSLLSVNQNENENSFKQEVLQLTSALAQCKVLKSVSLHLPVQFFFQDYLKQKNITEKTLSSNLKMLSKAKQIKVFELHLIKFKNTPNMRRRTQQVNDLLQYLKKGIVQNLSHLVSYQS